MNRTLIYLLIGFLTIVMIFLIVMIFRRKNKNANDESNTIEEDESEDIENEISEEGIDFELIDLFHSLGFVKLHEVMIEYEGDRFVMIASMKHSNPELKSEEEDKQENGSYEAWLHTIPQGKIHSQSRRVDVTEHLRELDKGRENLENYTNKMYDYGTHILRETEAHQSSGFRFENRAYLILETVIDRSDLYGFSAFEQDQIVKEKAYENLLRQMRQSHQILRKADHPLQVLDFKDLVQLFYVSLNRERSSKVHFYDLIENENFAPYISSKLDDRMIHIIQEKILKEQEIEKRVRDEIDKEWEKNRIELLEQKVVSRELKTKLDFM